MQVQTSEPPPSEPTPPPARPTPREDANLQPVNTVWAGHRFIPAHVP